MQTETMSTSKRNNLLTRSIYMTLWMYFTQHAERGKLYHFLPLKDIK